MQNKKILDYTLLRLLGKGGMAEVWYAENEIGKKAAVKVLLPKFCDDEAIVARFQNEAKVMVQLDHPNIRQVYSYASLEDRPCIVMEYLEGSDLSSRMKHGDWFTEEQLEKWWNQLVSALNYTHLQGVVHRDLKPSNIFITTDGNVKLLDFGIAKVRDSIISTATGAMMGTLMYMSPEQVRDSKHIDHKTDLYSLAVTFVHLLTGQAPYDRDTTDDFEIRNNIVNIPLALDTLPLEWQNFLRPYLAKNPADRPALVGFGAEAIPVDFVPPVTSSSSISEETFVGDATVAATRATNEGTVVAETLSAQPQTQPRKRRVWPWIVGACLVAIAVVVCVVLWLNGSIFKTDQKDDVDRGSMGSKVEQIVDQAADENASQEAAPSSPKTKQEGEPVKKASGANAPVQKPSKSVPAGYVDLGLSVYWKASNEWNSSDDHGFYTYDEAKSRFGSKLPTEAQYQELLNKCTWKWNGNGYKVTGPNGQSITLPAAGTRFCGDGEVKVSDVGSYGYYWSSTPNGSGSAWGLYFGSGRHNMSDYGLCRCQSVRLVQGK